MRPANDTTLAYPNCKGCPVSLKIQRDTCNKLKGKEESEQGNKCYIDELTKKGVIY